VFPTATRSGRSPDFDDDDRLPMGCPNCNATMEPNDDLCDACGYHLILKKVIDISEMPKRNKTTGFERVLQEQLHDPESASNTLLWVKILGCALLVGVLVLCLGSFWWIGVLAGAGLAGWWWVQHRKQGEGGVNRDPISLVAWPMILFFQRLAGWRVMKWPFRKARALTICDPKFQDDELEELERLNELEAIDLQGTGITDAGLDHLRSLKQLRFLVLRRTKVTPAAVERLQQDLPKTMIWS
jgi:hypothetical protein